MRFRPMGQAALSLAAAMLLMAGIAGGQEPAPIPMQPLLGEPPTLPETVVEGDGNPSFEAFDDYGYDPVLDGYRFGSPAVDGYRAESITAGTLIDVPEREFPGTVNVLPADLIRDQQILNFKDVFRSVGGVSQGGDGFFADRIFMRGMELQSRDFRKDGFLDPTFVPRDFQNIERVEILKGPASVLYGAGSPAGMVNLVTKKPVDDYFNDFNFTFGSFQQQRYTLDANGRATSDGNVLYRMNMAQEDVQSFRDFGFLSRTLIAPSITWKLDDATRLTYLAEYHRDLRRGDQGIPALGGDPLALPPSRYVGEPGNDFFRSEEFRQTILLTHDLSDDWTLQMGVQSLWFNYPASVSTASGNFGFLPPVPEPLFYRQRSDFLASGDQSQSFIASLAGEVNSGAVTHKLLAGMEYVYYDSSTSIAFGFLPPIDTTSPTYTNPASTTLGMADFPVFRQQRVGGYLQDLIEVGPHWRFLGGVRFDAVDFTFDRTLVFGPPVQVRTEQQFNRVSPRGGVVYLPFEDDRLAYYFNYSQSFAPPGGGAYVNPGNLRPVTGEAYELGIKAELVSGLALNVAGFHVTRQNAELNPSSFFLIQVGEERSQGVEMNLVGQIGERWSVLANYTYADVVLSDPLNPVLDGNRQRNVPFHSANLWARCNFYQDDVQTLGAALGLVYQGERPADLANTLQLPGFSRWDAGLFYTRGPWQAAVYLENLFDVEYATNSVNELQIFPGAPFNARATIGVTF